jgi:hypothetical protein
MLANIRKRLALLPPTLLGIGVLIFALTRFLPGGQSERRPVQESQLSAILGLSDPGTQRSWDSAILGLNDPGTQRSWDSAILGLSDPGTQRSWDSAILGLNVPGTQR